MIVRTYGRRNRGLTRTFSDSLNEDVEDQFSDSLSQENNPPPPPSDQLNPFSAFSSQDSSAFDFDPYSLTNFSSQGSEFFFEDSPQNDLGGRKKKSNKKARLGGKRELVVQATSTLMEAQEFGEMMEHVDEVNFALDGLRKGQPLRIRRASLLSLLSISGTAPQRRLLRTQGMAKTIIDAILALSFDDPTSNLAAATLFYVLTCEGQDDRLLESPMCVRFLIKMLKPVDSMDAENKEPKLGRRLLQVCKDVATTVERLDSSSSTIISKVEEILVSCKEIKPNCGDGRGTKRPELCPKWISLLAMEKACESTISLEETSGAVRKSGGNFKEKLQELGGLDAIFEVARNCHSDMEGWVKSSSLSIKSGKFKMDIKTLALLLKCLKIMENAAFLSNNNQNHLLGMKGNLIHRRNPISFTELVVNIIRLLSGLHLLKDSSGGFDDRKSVSLLHGTNYSLEFDLMKEKSNDALSNTNSSKNWWSQGKTASDKSYKTSKESSHLFSNLRVENSASGSENTSSSMAHTSSLKLRLGSSFTSGSSNGSLGNSNARKSGKNFGLLNKSQEVINLDDSLEEDSQDPFAFDDGECELSKWEVLSGKQKVSQTRKRSSKFREFENGCHQSRSISQEESSLPPESSLCSKIPDNEEGISLVADCLLASIKVLMNLTNDNPVGCRQIASCGGLETMCSLIACHFPMFSQTSSPLSKLMEIDHSNNDNDKHLSDQELDFLVAILGLLVNLIEKDGQNRSQLAGTSIPFPSSQGKEGGTHRDVIPLLCSIFLANKGAGEEAEEGTSVPWNDEEAVLEGEKEAEKMILEAYSALLLAFLSTESKRIRNKIADCLPDHSLTVLVPVLERFAAFHLTLNMISPETHKAVNEVIESCRIP